MGKERTTISLCPETIAFTKEKGINRSKLVEDGTQILIATNCRTLEAAFQKVRGDNNNDVVESIKKLLLRGGRQ